MKLGFIGNEVFAANVAWLEQQERKERKREAARLRAEKAAIDNCPSREWILDEFTRAVENEDYDRQEILLDAWDAAGYKFDE